MSAPATLQKKIGKAMLFIGWLLLLGFLISLFGHWEQAKINPNQQIQSSVNDGVREIILQRNSRGHYLLNAQVNTETISFLVDTGASQLVFTPTQAKKAGLIAGRSYVVGTANGSIQVQATQVDHLKMGDIELFALPAAINPHMDGYALLGMSALANLEWSQRGDKLTIRQF